MMGHINNLLLGMIRKHHGEAGIKRVFEIAGIPKRDFKTEVVYPEEEFQALYRATKELYGVGDAEAQKAFADYFMEISPKLFPAIFKHAGSARGLFGKVQTIHKQWPSAASQRDYKDKIWIAVSEKDRLVFKYDSPNRLCGVLRHVAEHVLKHYEEQGTVSELQCVSKGAPWCEVEVRFGAPAS